MQKEFLALIRNVTWELLLPLPNRKVIGNKWVFVVKLNPDRTLERCKSRLVAKGFH